MVILRGSFWTSFCCNVTFPLFCSPCTSFLPFRFISKQLIFFNGEKVALKPPFPLLAYNHLQSSTIGCGTGYFIIFTGFLC